MNPLTNNDREIKLKTILKDILGYNINCRNKKSDKTTITSSFLTYADKLYKHLTDKKNPKPEPSTPMIYGEIFKEPEEIKLKLPSFSAIRAASSTMQEASNPLAQSRGLTRSSSSKLGSPPRSFGLKTTPDLAGTPTIRPGLGNPAFGKRRKTRRNNKRI